MKKGICAQNSRYLNQMQVPCKYILRNERSPSELAGPILEQTYGSALNYVTQFWQDFTDWNINPLSHHGSILDKILW